jgi:hypothetical protein
MCVSELQTFFYVRDIINERLMNRLVATTTTAAVAARPSAIRAFNDVDSFETLDDTASESATCTTAFSEAGDDLEDEDRDGEFAMEADDEDPLVQEQDLITFEEFATFARSHHKPPIPKLDDCLMEEAYIDE